MVTVATPARASSLALAALGLLFGSAGASAEGPSLLVTSQFDHTVKEYDGTTGAFVRNVATEVGDPLDAIIGADGNLLVSDGQQGAIKRFDWATGGFLGNFAAVVNPVGMTMAAGKVYVCQSNPPQVVRSFDAVTGADKGDFVPTVGGGNPYPRDVKVANGRLYVAYWNLGTVEMFDLATRQSLGLLFPPGTGGLATPSSIAFGPDGMLYVSFVYYVNRYDPATGAFLGRFVDTGDRTGLRYAEGIAWGPDGNLYVATQNTAGVQRYDGTTGAFMDDFVPPGDGGLTAPLHIAFTPPSSCSAEVTFDLKPTTLYLKSPRLWVNGLLEPAAPFPATDIDISSVRLNGTVPATPAGRTALGDHDHDGIPDLMVKFDRAAVNQTLFEGDHVPITVTGTIGTCSFASTDYVRVRRTLFPVAGDPETGAGARH